MEFLWPRALCGTGAVTVTATVGFGATAEAGAAAAPETLKHVTRLLIGSWYENREAVNVGNIVNELPFAVAALLAPNRMPRV